MTRFAKITFLFKRIIDKSGLNDNIFIGMALDYTSELFNFFKNEFNFA
jgi:hypothetical protein